jgi:hypothetical protein
MTTPQEIEDIAEIRRTIDRLENALQLLSMGNELRVINAIAVRQPIRVFSFEGGLWWAPRPYPPPPQVPTRRNNLFGFEGHGSQSNVEVNLPIDRYRRNLQGALVKYRDGSVLLCHRGGVQHRRRSFSIIEAMEEMGATLVRVAGNTRPLIRVCSIDALQIQEISQFLTNVVEAKNS